MSKFVDSKGREWEFRFSVPTLIKVARKSGLTLNQIVQLDVPLADMLEMIPLFVDDQLGKYELTPQIYLAELTGEDLTGVLRAIMEALKEAFPQINTERLEGAMKGPFEPGNSEISSSSPESPE